jgi:ADP-ribose pyrophosphatase
MAASKTSDTKGKKRVSGAGKPGAGKPGKRVRAQGQLSRPTKLAKQPRANPRIEILSSNLSYEGPLFRVYTDKIRENGRELARDVIRHNGSVVILAIDDSKNKKDPMVVLEWQYRHAARQFLLEIPAGKLEEGEELLAGAKRELLEETGFQARRWRKLTRYFASPGFLGEWMQVFLAEGITAGDAQPEYDEQIEIRMLPVSEVLRMIEAGKIHDGKTLISLMLYDRLLRRKQVRVRPRK